MDMSKVCSDAEPHYVDYNGWGIFLLDMEHVVCHRSGSPELVPVGICFGCRDAWEEEGENDGLLWSIFNRTIPHLTQRDNDSSSSEQ